MHSSLLLALSVAFAPVTTLESSPGESNAIARVVATAPGLASTPAQDVDALLGERLNAAQSQTTVELLRAAGALRAGLGENGDAALDAALDRALGQTDKQSQKSRLFLCAARMGGGEYDRASVANHLIELLGAKGEGSDEIARGAALLLQNTTFRELKAKEQDALIKALGKTASDGDRAPEARMEAAVALHVQGGVDGQRAARKELMDFFASSNVGLKSSAALTLARLGDIETPREELVRLSKLPGEEGALAQAYLDQEEIRRLYDRRVAKLLTEKTNEIGSDKLKGKDDLMRIERMIQLIARASLEGDKHDREELIDAALDGMLRSLDEHSSYLTPKSFEKFDQELLSAEYGGIGAYVGEDPDDHIFTITRPIYSGPAYKAGLHSDDKIVRIDDWPTLGPDGSKPTDEIIKRLKGKPGTPVKIYVWRRGMDGALIDRPTEDMAVTITREMIEIPPVSGQLLPGGVGLVELNHFSNVASKLVGQKIQEFQKRGLRAVVLDLRGNSGGLLTEAVNVANLFVPEDKLIVTTESRIGDPEKNYTEHKPLIPADVPVVVLVNRFSASASEIVSGALQDLKRATIVGQRTFGKGSVQQLLPIRGEEDDGFEDENGNRHHDSWEKLTNDRNGNGEFDYGPRARMTIARYLLPSGRSIHRELDEKGDVISEGGVEPDEKVAPLRWETWKLEEMYKLTKERKLREWVEKTYTSNKDLLGKLADCDYDDPQRYPGFDELYNSLGTVLSAQDVRFLLRREVRRRVQDDRGAAFPDGDYQEDPQLQAAIRTAFGGLKQKAEDVPEYAATFEPLDKKDNKDPAANRVLASNMSDAKRSDLRHMLTLIQNARDGKSKLSEAELAELERALSDVIDK